MCNKFTPGACCGCKVRTVNFSPDFLQVEQAICFHHRWVTVETSYTEQIFVNTFVGGVFVSQTRTDVPKTILSDVTTETQFTDSEWIAGQFEWDKTVTGPFVSTAVVEGDFPVNFVRTVTLRRETVKTTWRENARLVVVFDASDMPWFGEEFRGAPIVKQSRLRTSAVPYTKAGYTPRHVFGASVRGVLVEDQPENPAEFDNLFANSINLHNYTSTLPVTSNDFKSLLPVAPVDSLTLLIYSTATKTGLVVESTKFGIADSNDVQLFANPDWKDQFYYDDDFNHVSKFTIPSQPLEIDASLLLAEVGNAGYIYYFDEPGHELRIDFIDIEGEVVGGTRYYTVADGAGWTLMADVSFASDDVNVAATFPVLNKEDMTPIPWNGFIHRYREYLWETRSSHHRMEGDYKVQYDFFPELFENDIKGLRIKISTTGEHRRLSQMIIRQIQNPADEKNMKCEHRATFNHCPMYHHQRFRLLEYSGEFSYDFLGNQYDNTLHGLPSELNWYQHHDRGVLGIGINAWDVEIEEQIRSDYSSSAIYIEPVHNDASVVNVNVQLIVGVDRYTPLLGNLPFDENRQFAYILVRKQVDKWNTAQPPTIEFDESNVIGLYFTHPPWFDSDGNGIINSDDTNQYYPPSYISQNLRIVIGPAPPP